MSKSDWPDLPDIGAQDPLAGAKLALFQARLDVYKAEHKAALDRAAQQLAQDFALDQADHQAELQAAALQAAQDFEREKATYAHHYGILAAHFNAYLEAAKAATARTLAAAELLQKAAAAIGTLYVAIIGLSFAATNGAVVLPSRGLVPGLFLGLAIVLSAAYVSYITPPADVPEDVTSATLPATQKAYRNTFLTWTNAAILRRRYLLQAAVVSLGVGVAALPLPYLAADSVNVILFAIIGILLVFAFPVITSRAPS